MTIRISSLDVESLDVGPNSLVYDVAVVSFDIDESLNVVSKDALMLRFDFMEQLLLGRTYSQSTVDFHEKRLGAEEFRKQLFGLTKYANVSIKQGLDAVSNMLSRTNELWVNHTTFDCGIFRTLAEDSGYGKELWHYRIENDVATARGSMSVIREATKGPPAHDAVLDAMWNLKVVLAFKERIKMLEALEAAVKVVEPVEDEVQPPVLEPKL